MLELRLPLKRASAHLLRTRLASYLAGHGVGRETVDAVVLAADEAFVNSFTHSGQVSGTVRVTPSIEDDRLVLEIRDEGCGFELASLDVRRPPDPLLAHGRGLFLIYRLMDEVEIRTGAGRSGTRVRMATRLSLQPKKIAQGR
jgi:serine/threonine-protein kinase RsbW